MLILIIIILSSMTSAFLCNIAEACLLSLSATDIARMAEKKPRLAALWKKFKDDIQRPIAVILIVNTLTNMIGATLAGAQFNELFESRWLTLFSLIFSYMAIQWSEILPKTMGVKYNYFFASIIPWPIFFLMKALSPLIAWIKLVNRPFEGKVDSAADPSAVADISVLARFAVLNKQISRAQEKLVARSINLSNRAVRDIMVAKSEMITLSTSMTLSDAMIQAHVHHHTRFPLIDSERPDRIVGYINFKDIVNALRINSADPTLRGICRPMIEVQDFDDLDALLTQLTRSYQHIALVKNSAREIVGIVTLEDVIESIVGDISDEYDVLPDYCYPITDTRFVAGGGITLARLRNQIGHGGEHLPDETTPLNDWLLTLFKRNPKAEDKITYNTVDFIVRKVRRTKIHEVIIEAR